jgi:beta-lactam-binding protein with PASTA domain
MATLRTKFRMTLGALLMSFVAFMTAAITLRVALHGGEVPVPDFSGMTVGEASSAALSSGLDLSIQDSYYSTTIPAGRILAQSPAAGSRVRKHWQVRVTESLGPQQVTIPDVSGQDQRDAAMSLRRNQLDLGTLAHIDAPGDADMVLAQTPPPNAGVDRPRVSLLLSQSAGSSPTSAFILPSFLGMSYSAANHAALALGIRVLSVTDAASAPPAGAVPGPDGGYVDASGAPVAMVTTPSQPSGAIDAQRPEAGSRANRNDTVKVYFGRMGEALNNPKPE